MKKYALLFSLILCFNLSFSQNDSYRQAEEYLSQKGEVNFSFQVNDVSEIEQWASQLSILNFDPSTNTIYAWANTQQFRNFQLSNIEFQVSESDNVIGPRLMSNQIQSSQYQSMSTVLNFPLTAYPTYVDYALQMQNFETTYPSLCQIVDIGGTTEGIGSFPSPA